MYIIVVNAEAGTNSIFHEYPTSQVHILLDDLRSHNQITFPPRLPVRVDNPEE
jgi:hypothetical protein